MENIRAFAGVTSLIVGGSLILGGLLADVDRNVVHFTAVAVGGLLLVNGVIHLNDN